MSVKPEEGESRAHESVSSIASKLPVESAYPALATALEGQGRALLQAPTGSGKSTAFPLWLLRQGATPDLRIVLVQPRRVAAASIARYLAQRCGSRLGEEIGLRTRYDQQVSRNTRLEVVTEGIFLRAIQRDPTLEGIGWVLFDEFHERDWQADLGLAFALESQREWREEQPLRLVVMSATLPGGRLHSWIDAPLIVAEGRRYPVEVRYAPPGREPALVHLAGQVRAALAGNARKVLVFLPGWSAIRRTAAALADCGAAVHLLHSSIGPAEQEAALAEPAPGRAAVVLATNIAETSLTIAGVDVVIDSGRVRRPRYDGRRGMNRLEEGWISRASAEQRAGRAGRVGPGECVRLWSAEQQGRLPEQDAPEIAEVDAAPVLLELAAWGAADHALLLDAPAPADVGRAVALLQRLGAFDQRGWLTGLGRRMAGLGLPPRLACMLLQAPAGRQRDAASLAALLSEGDFLTGEGRDVDVETRLQWLRSGAAAPGSGAAVLRRIRQLSKQLLARAGGEEAAAVAVGHCVGELLLAAYPDRLARRRGAARGRFLTVEGFEVVVPEADPLAGADWLVVAEHDGAPQGALARLAAAISEPTVREVTQSQQAEVVNTRWNTQRQAIEGRRQVRLGAIVLDERPTDVDDEQAQAIWRDILRERGLEWLHWPARVKEWLGRAEWLRAQGEELPDSRTPALLATLDQWLLPYINHQRKASELLAIDWLALLQGRMNFAQLQRIERLACTHWTLPSGRRQLIDYQGGAPRLAAKLTEFYGLDTHPRLGDQPLLLELLSPAGRPLQVTANLPGFWRGAYADVRKEMRGRYPKHYWPEQPWCAQATATTRRKMTP